MSEVNPYQSPADESKVSATIDLDDQRPIVFSGTMTAAELRAGWRLWGPDRHWSRVVFGLAFLFPFGDAFLHREAFELASQRTVVLVILGFISGLALIGIGWLRLYYKSERLARQKIGACDSFRFEFSASGLKAQAGPVRSECGWTTFSAYRSNEAIVVLYYRGHRAILTVTRRTMEDPTRWAELTSLLAANLELKK